jgi:hypothetical protein
VFYLYKGEFAGSNERKSEAAEKQKPRQAEFISTHWPGPLKINGGIELG